MAKDAKGFQKSLGGDIFTVSWKRVGLDDEPATTGKKLSSFPLKPSDKVHACVRMLFASCTLMQLALHTTSDVKKRWRFTLL